MERADSTLQHLPLPTAAAMIYVGLAGVPLDATKPAKVCEVLNLLASALSNVASIYSQDAAPGRPEEIPASEVLEAAFLRGANVLVTRTGKQYRSLTVRRRELEAAIAVLRRAGFAARLAGS